MTRNKAVPTLLRIDRWKICAMAAMAATPAVTQAQVWTGSDSSTWNDTLNWNPNTVPGAGNTATFSNASTNSSISLSGGTQAISTILFSGSNGTLGSYNLGVTAGDTFIFNAGGAITVSTNTATSPSQTISANIQTLGNLTITNSYANTNLAGVPGLNLAGNIAVNSGSTFSISAAANTFTLISGNISGTGGTSAVTWSGNGTIRFTGQSTYSGITNVSAGNNTLVQIGSSSVMSGTSIVSGPFGTGIFQLNSSTNAFFSAVGGDQTVANPINMLLGMTFINAPTTGYNADPLGGIHSLTFSGPITMGTSGRTINLQTNGTNSVSFGATGTNASTWTLPSLSGQSTLIAVSAGASFIINDVIQNPSGTAVGTVQFQNSGTNNGGLVVLNGANTYADTTNFTSVAGSGANEMVFEIPLSSVESGTNIVSGPFGKGTLTLNTNGNAPIALEPINSDQTIANTLNATGAGFWAEDAGTNLRSITLSGPISVNGHTYTDNINPGSAEIWGLAGTNASTLSLSGLVTLQSQKTPVGSTLIFNDLVSGTGSFLSKGLINVTLANAGNTFTGGFQIQGGSTVNINADGDLGAGTASVSIGATSANGSLIGTGTFTSANRPVILTGTGTDLIDVTGTNVVTLNGIVSGSTPTGLTKGTNTGTLILGNSSNSYSTGTTINGGALGASSDGSLGLGGTGITINAATLLATVSFSSGRPINLNDSNSTLDAASGNVLTLTGSVGGAGNLSTGTSGGVVQLAQSGGVNLSNNNVTVNATSLQFGAASSFTSTPNGPVVSGGGLSGPVTIGGALTINAGALAALNPSVPGTGQNNSIGSLSIGNGGSLDIGNHTVIVQNAPDETVIGKYLSNGYAGGFWNGTSPSGGAITSVVAFNDNSGATSVGYGNSSDFTFGGSTSPYRVGGPKALSGNQVVVAPALAGDLLLEGSVGPNDLALLLGAFGTTGNDWAFGNIDYDAAGLVGPNDLSLLLSNFGHTTSGFASAKTSAKSLTSTAKPSLTASASDVAPPPADGIELIVNFQSGDVEIEGNNATAGTSIVLTSAANGLVGGTTFTPAFSALFNTSASNTNGLIDQFNTFTNGSAVNGLVDLGTIYNTTQNSGDIQFQFSEKGINRGGLQTGSVTYVGVPEPTTLSLLAVASAGLLSRRRKRKD